MIVRWTKPVMDDLSHICDYMEKRLGATQACRAAMAIYLSASALKDMPLRGRAGRKPGTRELTVAGFPFVIVYRAEKKGENILDESTVLWHD